MEARNAQHTVASWLLEFAGPSYGPHGGAKLVAGQGGPVWLRSAASALREAGLPEPLAKPYADLAARVQAHAGDQATAALLVAAGLVRRALDRPELGVAAYLDGYALAARQAGAVLSGLAERRSDGEALGTVAPDGQAWVAPLVDGLRARALRRDGVADVDLSAIDLRAEGPTAHWLDGVVVEPQWAPPPRRLPEGGVLLLTAPWKLGLRSAGASYRIRGGGTAAWQHGEAARRGAALGRAAALGLRLVASGASIEEETCARLAAQGTAVWTDVPRPALERLERATGARRVPTLEEAGPADVGRARLERRDRPLAGWLARGSGPAATFVLPGAPAPLRAARLDAGERLLRAAGLHLGDARAVPGGGRWQREVAAALRRSADAAPGRAPFGVAAAAAAFDGLADLLVRNAGRDPTREALPPEAGKTWDSHPAVRLAVSAAFAAARQVLRVDDVHRKAPSRPAGLRGPGRPTPPVAGDVPPLM